MSNDAADGKKAAAVGGASAQRKESSIELQKMMDSIVLVKCIGGREFKGVLRGYDDLVNLVLDDSSEYIRGRYCPSSVVTSHAMLPLVRNANLFMFLSIR